MSLKIETPTVCAQLRGMVVGGKGYGISHRWDGTVLTVTSDSGSSSADLVGEPGPAGAELFVVELRLVDGVYTADKTFEELKGPIAAGNVVVCDFFGADSRTRCRMTTCTDYSITFVMQSVLGADEYFVFTADGVTHMTAEIEEDLPSKVTTVKDGNTVTVTAAYGLMDEVTTITLNDDGDPVAVTKDGKTVTLTWEGFDE